MSDEERKDEYKVPDKVGIQDLMERDKDDPHLDKYKKQLLGDPNQFYSRKFDYLHMILLATNFLISI